MRSGQPDNWNEREKATLENITLPDGAEFFSTPGHGFLRVDTSKLYASVSGYDYSDGPNHVLLEEDCSLTMWLAETGLIPMERYIVNMMTSIERLPGNITIRNRLAELKAENPGAVIVPPGPRLAINGKVYFNDTFIIAK